MKRTWPLDLLSLFLVVAMIADVALVQDTPVRVSVYGALFTASMLVVLARQ